MYEIDFIADQDKRQQQDLEKVKAWGMDQVTLEQILRRWGSRQVMTALASIHQDVTQDRSKLEWRILSHAYLTGGYDDPNPCSCDEIF